MGTSETGSTHCACPVLNFVDQVPHSKVPQVYASDLMDVELSTDFKNQVSRLRLDRSSYRGGNGASTRRHVERPKKQTMPVKMSLPSLPTEVEPDAEPTSPGNDPQKGEMHSHLWSSVKFSKAKQTESIHFHSAPDVMVPCKDEAHLVGKAPEDATLDSIDSLDVSIQKKLELINQPDENHEVPPGWGSPSCLSVPPRGTDNRSISPAQEYNMKSLNLDKSGWEDSDYGLSESLSREADSIETESEMHSQIHKKIKNIEESCDFTAPPGWGSRSGSRQPVQESGPSASANVTPSESFSRRQPQHANTSFSYAVSASDMEVELRPQDYANMPLRLRVPNADVFLITSDEDKYCGKHLKDLMEAVEFKLNEEEYTKCKVYLWDDMDHKSSIIDCITEAQEMCTYVFILLTKNFVTDGLAAFQKDDTLVRSVTTETRRWGIVPLYTQPKRDAPEDKAYKIPNGLISFKGLDMSRLMKDKKNVESLESLLDGDTYFRRGLVSMLEARVHERVDREAIRLKDREVWIEQRKKELRREMLMEQNRKRLEMDREERSIQQKLRSLPKELPLSPPSPVDFTKEEPWSRPTSSQRSASCDSNASYGGPPPGASTWSPQPQNPTPGQPMFGYPQFGAMMLNPAQQMMQHQQMLQMMQSMFFNMQPNMQPSMQPNMQPNMQPSMQPNMQFPGQQQPPYGVPYQAYPPAQPPMAPPQPPQPVDPSGQGTPVNNYYIHAGNVQVGAQSTMVTHEPSASAGYEDDADALAQKYNPDKGMEGMHMEPPQGWMEPPQVRPGGPVRTEPPQVRTGGPLRMESPQVCVDHHRDWYADPKKLPDEDPRGEYQRPYQHLQPHKANDKWVKGRRSPEEGASPQLPEKLPALNLDPDMSYNTSSTSQTPATTPLGPNPFSPPHSSPTFEKYYSESSRQSRQAQEGTSGALPRAPYSHRHPEPSEHTDTHISLPPQTPGGLQRYLGVDIRPIDPQEDRLDSYEEQTLVKVPGEPSTPKSPMPSYDPTATQTFAPYTKKT